MNRSETGLSPKPEMPDYCTEDHLIFLDDLRESGITNMYGAGSYLEEEYGIDRREAGDILQYWMKTFGARKV